MSTETLYISFILIYCSSFATSSRLQQADLSNISYDELHRLAIEDQVEDQLVPFQSLHTRRALSLNGLFDFCLDPKRDGFHQNWPELDLVEQCQSDNFYRMPVPSAFNDIVSEDKVKNYMGWFWYQRTFLATSLLADHGRWRNSQSSQWYLQFDSVNYMAAVWIKKDSEKAELVGSHVGGHLPFVLNISQILRTAKASNSFKLTVAVSNILNDDTIPSGRMIDLSKVVGHQYLKFEPDFDFFHFAGILGDVNLIKISRAHISEVTFDREGYFETGEIQFEVCLSQYVHQAKTHSHINVKLDHSGLPRAQCTDSYTVKRILKPTEGKICIKMKPCKRTHHLVEQSRVEGTIGNLSKSNNSSANRPAFSVVFSLESPASSNDSTSGRQHDLFQLKFNLPISPETLDSGQLQGFGMHHEQLFSGRTMSLAAIMKDIYLLKGMGANLIRTSHYPYSEAYLDACDESGLMVIAECSAVGLSSFSEIKLMLHKQLLLEMMRRDNRHSSIIMWSVANEPQSELAEARRYFESLLRFAREDLATFTTKARRPLTAAIAQSHSEDTIGDLLDVIMINRYYGWYDYPAVVESIRPALWMSLAAWASKHPDKRLIVSEFGADTIAGLHGSTTQIYSEEYQRDLIVEHEKVFDELARNRTLGGQINFIGSMIWNFADFSTHSSLQRVGGNRKGIFTRAREPKLAAESVRSIYRSRLLVSKAEN